MFKFNLFLHKVKFCKNNPQGQIIKCSHKNYDSNYSDIHSNCSYLLVSSQIDTDTRCTHRLTTIPFPTK